MSNVFIRAFDHLKNPNYESVFSEHMEFVKRSTLYPKRSIEYYIGRFSESQALAHVYLNTALGWALYVIYILAQNFFRPSILTISIARPFNLPLLLIWSLIGAALATVIYFAIIFAASKLFLQSQASIRRQLVVFAVIQSFGLGLGSLIWLINFIPGLMNLVFVSQLALLLASVIIYRFAFVEVLQSSPQRVKLFSNILFALIALQLTLFLAGNIFMRRSSIENWSHQWNRSDISRLATDVQPR